MVLGVEQAGVDLFCIGTQSWRRESTFGPSVHHVCFLSGAGFEFTVFQAFHIAKTVDHFVRVEGYLVD